MITFDLLVDNEILNLLFDLRQVMYSTIIFLRKIFDMRNYTIIHSLAETNHIAAEENQRRIHYPVLKPL